MKRIRLFICVLAAILFASCGEEKAGVPSDAAGAAEYYYKCLIDNDVEAWVDGTLYSESMPADIRQERIDMMRQYLDDEQRMRKGIVTAKATHDTIVDENAHVFIQLVYGDGSSEEVLLPMVKDGGHWKIK